jgi:hypothetical protein
LVSNDGCDFFADLLKLGSVDVGDGNAQVQFCKNERGSGTNTASGAGDDSDATFVDNGMYVVTKTCAVGLERRSG